MTTEQAISQLGLENSAAVLHPAGTVMFCRTASVGLFCITGMPMATTQAFVTWTPGDRLDSRYLLYVIAAMGPEFDRLAYGSTHLTIYMPDLEGLRVPLPPLDEQRQIVDFLDGQIPIIDSVVNARRAEIGLLTEQRDVLADRAFKDLRQAKTVPLRRVVAKWIDYRGATPAKTSSGIPLVTARNIRDGMIDMQASEEFIAEAHYDAWMRRGLPERGDVLLTTEAPLGQVAQVADPNIALAQRIILLRCMAQRVDPLWVYWYLRSPAGNRELWIRSTGTTAPGIKAERLREVPIPLPDVKVQRERLKEVEDVDRIWRASRLGILRAIDLNQELKRALITAAVTGKFVASTADGSQVPA
jgi:type I restriction enzyme S subunit